MENLGDLNKLISTKNNLKQNLKHLDSVKYFENGCENGLFIENKRHLNFQELEREFPGLKEKALTAFKDVFELAMLNRVKDLENEISKYEVVKKDI